MVKIFDKTVCSYAKNINIWLFVVNFLKNGEIDLRRVKIELTRIRMVKKSLPYGEYQIKIKITFEKFDEMFTSCLHNKFSFFNEIVTLFLFLD